jgi:hypothetical protein
MYKEVNFRVNNENTLQQLLTILGTFSDVEELHVNTLSDQEEKFLDEFEKRVIKVKELQNDPNRVVKQRSFAEVISELDSE